MDIQQIVSRINENSHLLSESKISDIERDILLEDLRSLYLLVKGNVPVNQSSVEQPKATVAEVEIKPMIPIKEAIVKEELYVPIVEQKLVVESAPVIDIRPVVEHHQVEVSEPIVDKHEPVQLSMQVKPETKHEHPMVLEFVQEEVKTKPIASLNEVFAGEEKSLNARLAGDKRPALNDQAGRRDLKSMIDFNKQYVLTNELFKGDGQAFQTAISRINDAPTIEAAFEYIKTDLLPKYRWSGEMQSARLFDKLVRQKFGV